MIKKVILILTLLIFKIGSIYAVDIDSMEIYTINWDKKGFQFFTIQDVINQVKTSESKITLYDSLYLKKVINDIHNNENIKNDSIDYFDFKTVCMIYYSDNNIDTLGFGHFENFYFKGAYYKLSKFELLDEISMKFPYYLKYIFEMKKSFYYYFHDKKIRY